MKYKNKLVIAMVAIVIISVAIVNVVDLNKDYTLRGTINIWANENSYDYLEETAEKFMDKNEKAVINVVKVNNYKNNLEDAITSGDFPDIVQLNSQYLREFEEKYKDSTAIEQNISIIDNYSSSFSKSRIEEINKDDKIIGIPFTSRPLVLYLREDMLKTFGYTYEDISTWDQLIKMGQDVFEKSGGKIKVLNAVGKDYEDLVSLLVMQAMEETENEDEIKTIINEKLNELISKNILNKDENGEFLSRISSINGMAELKTIEVECEWTTNNAPAKILGSNRFYVSEGDNLVAIKEDKKTTALKNEFIEFISTNGKEDIDNIKNGKFFLSFLSIYNSKEIEENVNNFKGNSPLVVMANIAQKAPSINDYDMYFKICDEYR
ncbi:ABC transporter substrate-binding protein [Clostridium vincentii]|uniref:Lactose-binding protein n=1 Tax=Clostridium vincentii TaxID=52704 RepID=A0A2T0BH18_9CLOT|nr:ABC transporter substrate-binding protein [Clostridium vincentii]PRR83186.1 Lactose-binding protein precursor [Clostridium vincentii]